ncbi:MULTISPECIES: LysM peptidoglycan-binding domain-containing protein [Vibrio]|uniref:LysM peptidoglycan-binding domain-containing protein n=1 Tax=Vibrio TaxID=662 RepID=UPI0013A64594|nr:MULTISPECIES: LysM domain-containing protein [Vibrio]
MKTVTKFVFAVLTIGVLSGCASNDEMVEQQKQNTEQIEVLKSQLQEQDQKTTMTWEAVAQLQDDQETLKNQAEQAKNKYRVKEHDTLFSIAQEHGMTLEDLIQLNSQIKSPNKITIGQEINLK